MIDLKIDETGDVVLSDLGDELISNDDNENDLQKSIQIILETKLGAYEFDEDLGMDQTNIATSKGSSPLSQYLVQDIETALIEQDERIQSATVMEDNFNPITRNMSLILEVETMDNTLNLESEVNIDGL